MAPASNLFRASRPAFRSQFFTSSLSRRNPASKRWQSTDGAAGTGANTGGPKAAPESWASRMWNSPIGVKTVHFWAPVMKWGLVLAGISDFARPAENLSLTQNAALTATGIIWTRWCLIIKPKNYLLAAVNFFLGLVGVIQVSRIVMYNQSQKALTAKADAEAKEVVQA
ncbi:hypothetical protein B0H67DRAFT_17879 [Lasiosphaeris hirsuta]|uniref:Mitochondrial pyruvate carrier n=1 Tax=Lasiosphaeris hirsuta TaxID=260670 RepID=A0AA40E9E9_9PEZI|nr:hypothetical protein B0H67DRAFT_17879 [Lasiosphaeris hirsuta]